MKNLINDIEIEVKKSESDEFNKAYSELFGEDLFEKAKHQIGDSHPKWPQLKWTDLGGGKFGWRTGTGRGKRGNAGNAGQANTGNSGEQKDLSTHAKETDTKTLKNVANSDKAPKDLKDAAKKELQNRGEEIDKQSKTTENSIIDKIEQLVGNHKTSDFNVKFTNDKSTVIIDGVSKKILKDENFKIKMNELGFEYDGYVSDGSSDVSVDFTKSTVKYSPNMRKLIDAFRISSNKYTDPEKMSITTTPKGNWELKYDGKKVSVINSLDIDQDEFDDLGITINSGNTSLSDKEKLRPVGTGTNGPERRKKAPQAKPDKKELQNRGKKTNLPKEMINIDRDLESYLTDKDEPFVYSDNGVYDLNKQGKKGYSVWVGFKHNVRGRQPVDRNKMLRFIENTAIKHLIKEVNKKTGQNFSENDVVIEDYWKPVDMFRLYIDTTKK